MKLEQCFPNVTCHYTDKTQKHCSDRGSTHRQWKQDQGIWSPVAIAHGTHSQP